MIKIKNLTKIFRTGELELVALNNLSFEVPSKQFLSISGRSGSGKSTLIYQISLLDHPSSGEVLIENQNLENLADDKRVLYRRNNFGFIFQDYALLPSLTAVENVMLPLLMQGKSPKEASEKAEEALKTVDLGERLNNLPSQLSGGQQQRVSIARAIVHSPKILFADEPTANLDSESSKRVLDIFFKLNRLGLTIIMVTHETDYAKLADRNIILFDGKIISDKLLKKKK